jgi:hypothetical protein
MKIYPSKPRPAHLIGLAQKTLDVITLRDDLTLG